MKDQILHLLKDGPLSKLEISQRLGHKTISGGLNKVIRLLLSEDGIELTIPEKPMSRSQKYRITSGRDVQGNARKLKK